MVYQQELLEKAYFIVKMTGPAVQFWPVESALRTKSQLCKLQTINIRANELQLCGFITLWRVI